MIKNLSNIDRIVRVVLGIALLFLGLSGTLSGALAIVAVVVGAVFIVTAAISFCPLYAAFKFSTLKS